MIAGTIQVSHLLKYFFVATTSLTLSAALGGRGGGGEVAAQAQSFSDDILPNSFLSFPCQQRMPTLKFGEIVLHNSVTMEEPIYSFLQAQYFPGFFFLSIVRSLLTGGKETNSLEINTINKRKNKPGDHFRVKNEI